MFQRIRRSLFGGGDEEPPLKYESTVAVLFSYYADGAFEKHYQPWRKRVLEVRENGLLEVCRKKNSTRSVTHKLHLNTFIITLIDISDLTKEETYDNIAIKVECHRDHGEGLISNFRCLLPRLEAMDFCLAAKSVAKRHNIDMFLDSIKPTKEEYLLRPSLRLEDHPESNLEAGQKPMIRTISLKPKIRKQLDAREKKEQHDKAIARRGAFKRLPVLFSNDLIHGSWWFTLGSVLITGIGIVVLISTFYSTPLGTDDSSLATEYFRTIWALLIFSGAMFSLGSAAFLRAMNDPPMKPVFKFKHLRTDALLGAWCFFFAVAPAIPYALIFLIADRSIEYLGMLIVAILAVFGTYLFVKACYPKNDSLGGEYQNRYQPYIACFCCHALWVQKHCSTDFLAACWVIYWATLVTTVLTFLYMLYGLATHQSKVSNFVNVSGFIDCIFFLIGSAYFVAGAYHLPGQSDMIADPEEVNDRRITPTNTNIIISQPLAEIPQTTESFT